MNFEPCDRTLNWEFAYWVSAIRQWYNDGLPRKEGISEEFFGSHVAHGPALFWPDGTDLGGMDTYPIADDVNSYFYFDKGIQRLPLNIWVEPPFEKIILKEDVRTTLLRDQWGVTQKISKNASSAPEYLRWPVKNRRDWEHVKRERFGRDIAKRLPSNYSQLLKGFKARDYPLVLGGYPFGFYGGLRFLFGDLNLGYIFYDDPGLVKEIQDHLTDLWIDLIAEVLKDVTPDFCLLWEDMAYKNGSMISPQFFKEFLAPYYRRLTDFLKSRGVKNILVDCDGNIWELIPLWIEVGITGTYPLEVNAGMEVVKIRNRFPRFQLMGGIDKIQLMKGKADIDRELERLPGVIEGGGYIPHGDHCIPEGVSWDNFKYYRGRLLQIIENTPVLSGK
jgi:uroporphyrinogen decarboxylase